MRFVETVIFKQTMKDKADTPMPRAEQARPDISRAWRRRAIKSLLPSCYLTAVISPAFDGAGGKSQERTTIPAAAGHHA
jgi:hypothetical protein